MISTSTPASVAIRLPCFAPPISAAVSFPPNLLASRTQCHQDMVAAVFHTIFAQPDADTVAATWDPGSRPARLRFPKIGVLMDAGKAEVLAFTAFPKAHWVKIWSTNPLEGINKEIKRRSAWSASSPTKHP